MRQVRRGPFWGWPGFCPPRASRWALGGRPETPGGFLVYGGANYVTELHPYRVSSPPRRRAAGCRFVAGPAVLGYVSLYPLFVVGPRSSSRRRPELVGVSSVTLAAVTPRPGGVCFPPYWPADLALPDPSADGRLGKG